MGGKRIVMRSVATVGWLLAGVMVFGTTPAWTLTVEQEVKLLASDPAVYSLMGWSVALDGDTVLCGAPRNDDNAPSAGAAYVFRLYDDDVPATSYRGMAVMVLLLLAASTLLLRRL
jgi:hypothetical protein